MHVYILLCSLFEHGILRILKNFASLSLYFGSHDDGKHVNVEVIFDGKFVAWKSFRAGAFQSFLRFKRTVIIKILKR